MPVILNRNFKIVFGFLGIMMLSTSCNKDNCDGVDVIHSMDKIILLSNDTVQYMEKTTSTIFGVYFSIWDEVNSRDGTRRCRQKDLAVEYEDMWDKDKISFTCNQALKSDTQIFLANTELIGTNITHLKFDLKPWGTIREARIDLYPIDGITKSEDYKFTLTMITDTKKKFTTTKSIFIKK